MEFISHWLSLFNSCLIQRTGHGIHLTLAQFVQQLSHPKDETEFITGFFLICHRFLKIIFYSCYISQTKG